MPEVIFPGPEGRLEGRYHPQKEKDAPIAIVLHPHPQFGGTMNNKVVYNLHYAFYQMGFTVLRFNFRGVGRSQGEYDQGIGELSDAASALDYLQSMNNNSKHCWVAGFSFGAWIGMQLLMRRPELSGALPVFWSDHQRPSGPRGTARRYRYPREQTARTKGHYRHPRRSSRCGPLL